MNDKPDLDIGITKSKIPNQFNTNINHIPSFTNPSSTISSQAPQFQNYPSSASILSYQCKYPKKNMDVTFFNRPPSNIPTNTYNSVINADRKPISGINYTFGKKEISHNNDNPTTNSIINLLDSKSDKILKNI